METLYEIIRLGIAYIFIGAALVIVAIYTIDVEKIVRFVVYKGWLPQLDRDIDVDIPEVIALVIFWPIWLTILMLQSIWKSIIFLYIKSAKFLIQKARRK